MEGLLDTNDTLSARQFFIAVRRLADHLNYGTDRSPFLGSGNEYVQSRPYVAGDSIRSIDWRVTARTGRYHVKEFEAPRQMPAYLLVDTSASMAISSLKVSKYSLAVHIAGGLAFALLDRVSPVGLVGVGERPLRFEPSLSRARVMLWLHQLRRYRHDERTTLARRIAEVGSTLPSRSLVVVLSDLLDPAAIAPLKQLAQRHDCAVLRLLDPAERGIPGGGILRGGEAETGHAFVARAGALGRYHAAREEALAGELRRSGIDFLELDTAQPCAARLRHFFRGRNLLGRGKR